MHSETLTSTNYSIPVNSHHARQENPISSSDIPYTSPVPNTNIIPQMSGNCTSGRRCSSGPYLSALFESNNEHNLNTANISTNYSDTSADGSTGNVMGGMIGAQNNSSISSGPKYSLEMLIAALDSPTQKNHENQSQQETGFASCQPSQQQFDNTNRHGNGHHRQETQPQVEHWAPQIAPFASSSDNGWRQWTPSGEYMANPGQRFTQRMDYGMGYQGTMGYNGNANFTQAPTFCGQSSSAGSLHATQNSNNNNNSDRGSARTKQEENMTYDALKGLEMVNLNWMQQNHPGGQLMTDNVTRLDASVIHSPPESAFYSQRTNSAQTLQNQMRQQQLRQYGNTQSMYGHQTPPTTILRTPPPSGGMQSYVHDPQSVNFGLSRKRSVPNDELQLPLDINNGSGTLSPTEEDMMMRKRSKSFDIAMILANQGGMTSRRSSGQFLQPSAFREHATQAYPGQMAFNIDSHRALHGRAVTTSHITETNHGMGADSCPSRQTSHPMFDPQTLAIAAQMKNPPPAQCGENIPSVPILEEETDDEESRPRRQLARYPGDLYTPQWVRYVGQSKQGFCDTCSPGKWLQLKNSAYWYHKQFFHGISSVSGKTFLNPLDQRIVEQDVVEGLCHQCHQWIPISSSKRKNCVLWYRHAHKCHIYHKPKNAVGMPKQF